MTPPTSAASWALLTLLLSAVFGCGSAAAPSAPAEAPHVPTATPSPGARTANTFDRKAAKRVLDFAAEQVKQCGQPGGPSGPGRVEVRYGPSGKVVAVLLLTERFENTVTASCIRLLFRRAEVPAFTGAAMIFVQKSFEVLAARCLLNCPARSAILLPVYTPRAESEEGVRPSFALPVRRLPVGRLVAR
jgi:hypothetical protein